MDFCTCRNKSLPFFLHFVIFRVSNGDVKACGAVAVLSDTVHSPRVFYLSFGLGSVRMPLLWGSGAERQEVCCLVAPVGPVQRWVAVTPLAGTGCGSPHYHWK